MLIATVVDDLIINICLAEPVRTLDSVLTAALAYISFPNEPPITTAIAIKVEGFILGQPH